MAKRNGAARAADLVDIVILGDGETFEAVENCGTARVSAADYVALCDGVARIRDVHMVPGPDLSELTSGAKAAAKGEDVDALRERIRAALAPSLAVGPRTCEAGALAHAIADVVTACRSLGWDVLDPIEGAYWSRWHEAIEGGARDAKEMRAGAVAWEERVGEWVWDAVAQGTGPGEWMADDDDDDDDASDREGGAA